MKNTGYFFIIEYNDGIIRHAQASNLKELQDYDRFTMDKDKFNNYLSIVTGMHGYSTTDIKNIRIAYRRERSEKEQAEIREKNKTRRDGDKEDEKILIIKYGLVDTNPYMHISENDIVECEVYGINKYKSKQFIIKSASAKYREMKEYLIKNLKENPKNFLENVYPYNNAYRRELGKYASLYSSDFLSEEDSRDFYRIQRNIEDELSKYKIYRSVASRRFFYEVVNNIEHHIVEDEVEKKDEYVPKDDYEKSTKVLDNVEEYNQKYEEFIDPEEYDQMTGYSGDKVL